MGVLAPSSRAVQGVRFSAFDAVWAAVSPLLALIVRDATSLSYDGAIDAALYCAISTFFALGGFVAFRLRDVIAQYFSVQDAIDIAKAVVLAELLTCIVLFTFTRLDGIPRSTPVIHALILGAGLVVARSFVRVMRKRDEVPFRKRVPAGEGVILIGLNELSSLYMKCLDTFAPGEYRVIAVLDARLNYMGRSIHGVRVMGPPSQLESLIEEFAVHGIRVDRVVVAGDETFLSTELQSELQRICTSRGIQFEFVANLFARPSSEKISIAPSNEAAQSEVMLDLAPSQNDAPAYWRVKRAIDFIAAFGLLLLLSPLWALTCVLAFIDVGFPIFFWQQRTGLRLRDFLLYKVRTLRAPFDCHGRNVPEEQRLSAIGRWLRRTRFDEWPQLLNVLVGDMSLIGPRPLLPCDQPPGPNCRLMMRPGITGWAQVQGGRLLSPEEKAALDEWYIANASLWLDLRILAMTLISVFRGDRRQIVQVAEEKGSPLGKAIPEPLPRRAAA